MSDIASPSASPNLARGIAQRAAQVLGGILIYGILLFVSAGRLDWPAAWYFLLISLIVVVVNSTVLLIRDPAFIAARGQVRPDVEAWDRWVTALAGFFMSASLIVPGLDLRLGWSTGFPLGLQLLGFIALIGGYALFSWAMLSNQFFETGVRLQADRGQTVATAGPYRLVRHPGYVGMIVQLIATPLALASWWGFLPAAFASIVFVVRTALEDRTLQRSLPGYADFARRVRYRLLPGVW